MEFRIRSFAPPRNADNKPRSTEEHHRDVKQPRRRNARRIRPRPMGNRWRCANACAEPKAHGGDAADSRSGGAQRSGTRPRCRVRPAGSAARWGCRRTAGTSTSRTRSTSAFRCRRARKPMRMSMPRRSKPMMGEITAISRKSRDDGNQYWGRIPGTPYDRMAQEFILGRFKQLGLQDIRRQDIAMKPLWYPTAGRPNLRWTAVTTALKSAFPITELPGTAGDVHHGAGGVGRARHRGRFSGPRCRRQDRDDLFAGDAGRARSFRRLERRHRAGQRRRAPP